MASAMASAARNAEIVRYDFRDPAHDREAAGKAVAVSGAAAERDHPFGGGRGVVGSLERLLHVPGHRPGDQQHVGMAWRGDEADAEALYVVKGVAQRMHLQ
jgi:hypothetical protein